MLPYIHNTPTIVKRVSFCQPPYRFQDSGPRSQDQLPGPSRHSAQDPGQDLRFLRIRIQDLCIAFTYLIRWVNDNIYELRNKDMLVRIDTKNWLGNYNSTVKQFQNQQHLDNYLSKCYSNESYSKIIGISTLQS